MHKSSAWPLALVYAALIVFASLFPFDGWRAQGITPEVFLVARIPPPYWTGFDITINVIGYAPLGFFLALALLRTGCTKSIIRKRQPAQSVWVQSGSSLYWTSSMKLVMLPSSGITSK